MPAVSRGLRQCDRGPLASEPGRLLERVAHLQHAEIVAVPADDLDADGQPLGREAGRHREGGTEASR